jgi:hypothetical protein
MWPAVISIGGGRDSFSLPVQPWNRHCAHGRKHASRAQAHGHINGGLCPPWRDTPTRDLGRREHKRVAGLLSPCGLWRLDGQLTDRLGDLSGGGPLRLTVHALVQVLPQRRDIFGRPISTKRGQEARSFMVAPP